MADAILILGGPQWSEKAVIALKELGFEIVLTDLDPSCACRKYADRFIHVSASDTASILRHVSTIDNLAVAYCGNDFGTMTAHRVNEAIQGRPLLSEPPEIFVDKSAMKAFFNRAHIPTASGQAMDTTKIKPHALDYPLVFKPVAASGAVAVRYIKDAPSAQAYIDRFAGRFPTIVVESAIEGTQHDVNGFFVEGRFFPAGIGDRFFSAYPLCYPLYGYCPTRLPEDAVSACYSALEKVGRAAGLATGPLKADLFYTQTGEVVFIEVGLRFHGDITSAMVMPLCGRWFPLVEYVSHLAMDTPEDARGYLEHTWFGQTQTVRWDIIRFLPGIFQGLQHVEAVRRFPELVDIFLRKRKGERLGAIEDNSSMLGYFLTRGRDTDHCAAIAETIHRILSVNVNEA